MVVSSAAGAVTVTVSVTICICWETGAIVTAVAMPEMVTARVERDWARVRVGRETSAKKGRASDDKRAEINIAIWRLLW